MRTIVLSTMLAALVVGCVDYDERIELNADGSGIVRMHLSVSEQMLADRGKEKIEKESDLLPMPQQELIRDIEKEGFRVRSLRAESSHGHRHFYLVLEFKDLQTLAKSEFFGGRKVSLKHDGAKWTFRQEIQVSEKALTDHASPRKKDDAAPGEAAEKKSNPDAGILKQLETRFGKERVRQMLSAYSISFSLKLADAVLIHNNGRNHHDTTAVWEITLDQLIDRRPTLCMEADFAVAEKPGANP